MNMRRRLPGFPVPAAVNRMTQEPDGNTQWTTWIPALTLRAQGSQRLLFQPEQSYIVNFAQLQGGGSGGVGPRKRHIVLSDPVDAALYGIDPIHPGDQLVIPSVPPGQFNVSDAANLGDHLEIFTDTRPFMAVA